MRHPVLVSMVFVVLSLSGCGNHANTPVPATQTDQYQHIDWSMLTPPGWDSMRLLKGLDFSKLQDSDPKAIEALKNIRESWTNAPVVQEMNGRRVNLIGYVAPLDGDLEHVKEFLLVPYFGACIHTPPPPSNQIVHVHLVTPIPMMGWDADVSVNGTLEISHSDTALGTAGYQMSADIVKQFKDTVE